MHTEMIHHVRYFIQKSWGADLKLDYALTIDTLKFHEGLICFLMFDLKRKFFKIELIIFFLNFKAPMISLA